MAWRRVLLIATVLATKMMVILGTVDLPNFLLPDDIVPVEYKLTLVPYMRKSTPFYDCSVIILLECRRKTNSFAFHAGKKLNLTADKFVLYDSFLYGRRVQAVMEYQAQMSWFVVTLPFTAQPGSRFVLAVDSFRGFYSQNWKGFYRHPNRGKIRMVLTQFQENEARNVFPCFDEPRFKSIFSVVIYRQRHLNVETRANAPLKGSYRLYSGWSVDVYEPTIAIPSYLVAFAAFRKKYYRVVTQDILVNGSKIEVSLIYNRREASISQKANSTCKRCSCTSSDIFQHISQSMNYMTSYLGSPYAMSKYDIIFSASAPYSGMENMGLVVFKAVAACSERVHAHEVIHQWIGNLVSPYWWGDMWLSEGFTTYYAEDFVRTRSRELWPTDGGFRIKGLFKIMVSDAEGVLPPITHSFVEKLSKKLGAIYGKAAAVVSMLTSIIGEDTLQDVMRKYYQIHQYSNVTHLDLIKILEQYFTDPSIDIGDWVETWIHNAGFPVVIFSRTDEKITARQIDVSKKNITWPIPLTWTKDCNEVMNTDYDFPRYQFFMNESVVELPVRVADDECFLANPHQEGYYLAVYDPKTWRLLQKTWQATVEKLNTSDANKSFRQVYHFRLYESYITIAKYLDFDNSTRTAMNNYMEPIPGKIAEMRENFLRWINRKRSVLTTEEPSVSSTLPPR